MAIAWSALSARVRRMLNDVVVDGQDPTWSADDLTDYINAALSELSDHTPQYKTEDVTLASGDSVIELPDDLISLGPVRLTLDGRVVYLEPAPVKPGLDATKITSSYGYYIWGQELRLLAPVTNAATVALAYYAYWDRVTGDSSQIRAPRWAEEALLWYCVYMAVSKPGVDASMLQQYKTRSEAGAVDNPLLEYANYALKRWTALLAERPSVDRNDWAAEVG